MSECIGKDCHNPEHRQMARETAAGVRGRADTPPPGVAPEKWNQMSRRERRDYARRVRRG